MKRKALGKGLKALLPEPEPALAPGRSLELPIDSLEPNPFQPRARIRPEQLAELAASIREAGLFDAVKINEPELQAIYQFDYAFFDLSDQVGRALDNVEASLGDKAALPAAIRNTISLARLAVETYNRRYEAVVGTGR